MARTEFAQKNYISKSEIFCNDKNASWSHKSWAKLHTELRNKFFFEF